MLWCSKHKKESKEELGEANDLVVVGREPLDKHASDAHHLVCRHDITVIDGCARKQGWRRSKRSEHEKKGGAGKRSIRRALRMQEVDVCVCVVAQQRVGCARRCHPPARWQTCERHGHEHRPKGSSMYSVLHHLCSRRVRTHTHAHTHAHPRGFPRPRYFKFARKMVCVTQK
jgi:hypothetical protein